ncbi:MAG: hypothetical protein NVV66_18600 [Cellulomonas sp.]|uniref:hypothetical protein n=1 Tax=Cellulomonas sp. TaxID=40001 RepID=UPI00258D14A0|nr:hypothetical protein [Cellulomonas sp.]MCR6706606.1 hypothetical protein [Cellulomonas sp.]
MEAPEPQRRSEWRSTAPWLASISLALSVYLTVAGARHWPPFPAPDDAMEDAARVSWSYERLGWDAPGSQTTAFVVTLTNNSTHPVYAVRLRLALSDDRIPWDSSEKAPDLPTSDVPLELRDVAACSVSTATVPVSIWRDTNEDAHIDGYSIGVAFKIDGQQWWSDQPYQRPWRDDTVFGAYSTPRGIAYETRASHGPGCG